MEDVEQMLLIMFFFVFIYIVLTVSQHNLALFSRYSKILTTQQLRIE